MKRRLLCFLALAAPVLLVPPALRGGGGAVVKVGGSFDVEVVRNVAYHEGKDADDVRHKLDLYLPKAHKDFPVLLFVHGGAWRSGSKELYTPLGRLFAKNGIGTVVINYRLSPKVKHPAHIEDVARAFAWTHRTIAKHGGNPERIFACGHSAGGHLVALLGTDARHLKAENLSPANIRGVIALSGVYEISATKTFESAFGKDEKACKDASPLTHVKGNHPPTLLMYAEKDYPLLDVMGERMCKALKGCKCEATALQIANRTHISIIVMMASQEDPATQAALEFIARHSGMKLTPREKK
jgi:acetyl esterase/lipase